VIAERDLARENLEVVMTVNMPADEKNETYFVLTVGRSFGKNKIVAI